MVGKWARGLGTGAWRGTRAFWFQNRGTGVVSTFARRDSVVNISYLGDLFASYREL